MAETLEIQVVDDIGGWGYNFRTVLDQIKSFKGNVIRVPINSYGGSVTEGISIYNLLKGRSEKIEASIIGYALSMGGAIAMSADEVIMPENGFFMLHNPWGGVIGDKDEVGNYADLLENMTNQLAQMYSRKTGMSEAKIKKLMREETWLSPKEAKAMGFVDRISKGADLMASFDPKELNKFEHVPDRILNLFNQNSNVMPNSLLDSVKAFFGKKFTNEQEAVAFLSDSNLDDIVSEKVNAANKEVNIPDNLITEDKLEAQLAKLREELTPANHSEDIESLTKHTTTLATQLAELANRIEENTSASSENQQNTEDKFKELADALNVIKTRKSGTNQAPDGTPPVNTGHVPENFVRASQDITKRYS